MKLVIITMMMLSLNAVCDAAVLKECVGNFRTDPRLPDEDMRTVDVVSQSSTFLNDCPVQIMVDQWYVYHLDQMNKRNCQYTRGQTTLTCDK